MYMEHLYKSCAVGFIESIWNNGQFDRLSDFLHPCFRDHSLPFFAVQNESGLRQYIQKLSQDFTHKTIVADFSFEGDMVALSITMELKYSQALGENQIDAQPIVLNGYRYLRMMDGKIRDHWEDMFYTELSQ